MLDVLTTISKASAEYSNWRQHGCALFVLWKTQNMSTGTEMQIPEDVFQQQVYATH